jgi:hypothetical protein
MVDQADFDSDDGDAQDVAEVYDEDNTNIEALRQGGREDAEQFEDLPDVYDATRAQGDDRDEDEEFEEDDLEDDSEDWDRDPRDRDDRADDGEDEDEVDGLEARDPDEVDLEFIGDVADVPGAKSSAADLESASLDDDDLRALHYKEDTP